MEIEGSDGSKFKLKPNSTTIFGRGNGFYSNDLTVSRRQVSFDFNPSEDPQTAPRVSFEVLGKNPIWVHKKQQENGNVKGFKRFQRGDLGIDDLFCVSAKTPIWFTLKNIANVFEEREKHCEEVKGRINADLRENLETASGFEEIEDIGLDFVDLSNIDPIQEFGFVVIGHEFDQYPKHMIRDIKKWDWFLDDPKRNSDDEEDSEMKGFTSGRKRKKTNRGEDDDVEEEWTAESEGEELTTNAGKVQRPKYDTRSKDHGVRKKGTTNRKSSTNTSTREEEEESEDDEDETLGGFIVTDDDDTVEEDGNDEMDEDEEEEFIEDELED
ncbi:uncharacterized protein LOC110684337 [Chenopodium quinoa]|uniref:uncharacterized protein LOC110684337 n=1 Tax=Chenopodium quinoa TaxID=63459 RepID=UPI000B77257F|nr:uncharacterized protein LOC110684337 [Chenopodium quinoa]